MVSFWVTGIHARITTVEHTKRDDILPGNIDFVYMILK